MRLAKPHLDIGLFTQNIEPAANFWSKEVGLRIDTILPMRSGWAQHRFDAHDSVIKINHYVDPLPQIPLTGYVELIIACEAGTVWAGKDPDGNRVRLVPRGLDGVTGVGIVISSPDPARLIDFYVNAMEFDLINTRTACCGDTLLFFVDGPGGSETTDFIGFGGYRYLTVQIYDADDACNGIIARGGRLARAPENYGKVARVGFVKDPDGNWIEISARASLTGVVPA
ncbi:VOC family protein [Aquisediminimonas sediminicola]|uniref:VOC family protein n=1 Tax=Alteraquisediminimonas sediminicola TaxID=2676787 RepID=UPI001C8F11DF|nr:VOC family protein [Aquisediminimonas sediminicola]